MLMLLLHGSLMFTNILTLFLCLGFTYSMTLLLRLAAHRIGRAASGCARAGVRNAPRGKEPLDADLLDADRRGKPAAAIQLALGGRGRVRGQQPGQSASSARKVSSSACDSTQRYNTAIRFCD